MPTVCRATEHLGKGIGPGVRDSSVPPAGRVRRPTRRRIRGCHARRLEAPRRRFARPARRHRRRQRRRELLDDHVRGTQPDRQSARPRTPRPRCGGGGPDRVVRAELARDHCGGARRPQGRTGGRAAVLPFHGGGDGLRDRQLGRDLGRRRRRLRAPHRIGAGPDPEGQGRRRILRHGWAEGLARRLRVVVRMHRRPVRGRTRGGPGLRRWRADALHLGHHRQAQGRAADVDERARGPRPARRARLPDGQRGPHHHRPDVPLGSARVRRPQPLRGITGGGPASLRSRGVDRRGEDAQGDQHVLGADAVEADRLAARRRARPRRLLVDAVPDRERGAGPLRAEAGGDRQARRRLPLRGLRLHRDGHHHRAAPRGSAPQAGLVRQGVRRHRVPHRA